jgi:hypothetical protein
MRSLTHPLQRTPAFFSGQHLPPLARPDKSARKLKEAGAYHLESV